MSKPINPIDQGKKDSTREFNIPEKIDRLKLRMRQGAWIRLVASVTMWFFALAAYWIQVFDFFSFIGICFSILYLILITPSTLWILKSLKQENHLSYLGLTVNGLEVVGYTAIIYFSGGLNVSYMTLIYLAVIIFVGVMGPSSWPFFVTGFCSLSFTAMVLLIYFQIIPVPSNILNHDLPLKRQLFDVGIITLFLLLIAFTSAYTSQMIKKGRKRLREQNQTLSLAQEQLKQVGQVLQEKNLELQSSLEAMEKAQSSDRMKSEFLSTMSHELRTPLNHIIGFSELLSDQYFGALNPTQSEYLGDILQSGRHLLLLINDILDLSKIEAGKLELEYSEIPLRNFLENSLTMIKGKALNQGIKLHSRFLDIPSTIWADERKLKQILFNLLANAVKFTPQGGAVHLEAKTISDFEDFGQPVDKLWALSSSKRLSRAVRISEPLKGDESEVVITDKFENPQTAIQFSVTDTGIGLREEDLDRIFNPFEQADKSVSRNFQGTGLGLSLAKQMVELHSGRVWAESEGLGKGSTFYLVMPINQTLN